jgi:hypothetical protein
MFKKEQVDYDQFNLLNFFAFLTYRTESKLIVPCWLVMSKEAKERCLKYTRDNFSAELKCNVTDETIIKELQELPQINEKFNLWKNWEIEMAEERNNLNPLAWFSNYKFPILQKESK